MFSILPSDDYYVEVSRDLIVAQNLTTGERSEHHPAVYVSPGQKRYEFADGADGATNGFGHPRAFVGDFSAASGALNRAIASVRRSKLSTINRLLLHVQETYEGGLSQPELRAGKDLGIMAGAKSVRVYDRPGRLSRTEVERLLRVKHGSSEPGLFL